jgi:hypothetical protein
MVASARLLTRPKGHTGLLNVLPFYCGAEGDVGRNGVFSMEPRDLDPPSPRLATQTCRDATRQLCSTFESTPSPTATSVARGNTRR